MIRVQKGAANRNKELTENRVRQPISPNMSPLPPGWKYVKLGEVCETTSGGTPSRRRSEYYGGNIPWVKSGELDDYLVKHTEEKITGEAIKNSNAKIFPKGTLLIALYGATIGKLSFLGVDAATNQAVCGIFKSAQVDSKYLYYFLSFKRPNLIQQGIGGAQPNISQGILRNLLLPLPSFPTQRLIVSKIEELFSELDKGVEQLRTVQQQLKTYRQAVLKAAFEGKLTNEGRKEPKNGELPEGWKWVKLGEAAKKISKKVLPIDYPDVKFIGMDSIQPHSLKLSFTYNFGEFKSSGNYFEKEQVLYGRMRPYLNKVYKAEYNGICSGEFIILQCSNNFYPDLLKYILHSKKFVSFANHKTSGDRPRISYEEIIDYPIALPTLPTQRLIVSAIESRLSVADKLEETISGALAHAEALRQSILKKAFNGELVNNNSNQPEMP